MSVGVPDTHFDIILMVRVAYLGLTDVQSSFPAYFRYCTVDKATNNKIHLPCLVRKLSRQ
jgi:hypothetical protein